MEQHSTAKSKGARLNSAYRSRALRHLEQSSTGKNGAELGERLVGARLDNKRHRSRAQQCLPGQSSTVTGAKLDQEDRRGARRSLSWKKTRRLRAQRQCLPERSSTPTGAKFDRDDRSRAPRLLSWRILELSSTEMIRAGLEDQLFGVRLDIYGHRSKA